MTQHEADCFSTINNAHSELFLLGIKKKVLRLLEAAQQPQRQSRFLTSDEVAIKETLLWYEAHKAKLVKEEAK